MKVSSDSSILRSHELTLMPRARVSSVLMTIVAVVCSVMYGSIAIWRVRTEVALQSPAIVNRAQKGPSVHVRDIGASRGDLPSLFRISTCELQALYLTRRLRRFGRV